MSSSAHQHKAPSSELRTLRQLYNLVSENPQIPLVQKIIGKLDAQFVNTLNILAKLDWINLEDGTATIDLREEAFFEPFPPEWRIDPYSIQAAVNIAKKAARKYEELVNQNNNQSYISDARNPTMAEASQSQGRTAPSDFPTEDIGTGTRGAPSAATGQVTSNTARERLTSSPTNQTPAISGPSGNSTSNSVSPSGSQRPIGRGIPQHSHPLSGSHHPGAGSSQQQGPFPGWPGSHLPQSYPASWNPYYPGAPIYPGFPQPGLGQGPPLPGQPQQWWPPQWNPYRPTGNTPPQPSPQYPENRDQPQPTQRPQQTPAPTGPNTASTDLNLASLLSRLTTQTGWKVTDLGLFWPDAMEDTFGKHDIFYDKQQVCYRDVELWIAHIQRSCFTQPQNVIASSLATLLRGSAAVWYQQQLSRTEQTQLDHDLNNWFLRLRKQFGIKYEDAGTWLTDKVYSMEDCFFNKPVRSFALDCFKYSRAWGDSNDLQILTRLHSKLFPELKALLDPPTAFDTLDSYLGKVDEKQRVVHEKLKADAKEGKIKLSARSAMYGDENDEDVNWTNWNRSNNNGFRGRSFRDRRDNWNRQPRSGSPRPRWQGRANSQNRQFGAHDQRQEDGKQARGPVRFRNNPPFRRRWFRFAKPRQTQDGNWVAEGDIVI
jgi:hypothetical protein